MNTPLGTLHTVDGRPVLRYERRLAHPPEKVWKAVADPAEMAHWFPANVETELKTGARMRFSFGDDKFDLGANYTDGEILEIDPPKVYVFRWVDSVLRFELLPEESGCRLVFTYALAGTGFEDRPSVARVAPGWDICLDVMAARLDGKPAPDVGQAWVLARAEAYVEEFGLAEGEVHDGPDGYLVRFERDLVQAPEEVWAVLTGQDESVAVGSQPPVQSTHGYVTPGRVTEVEPQRVLEYAWLHGDAPAGRVRFELGDQEPIGTRLVVTQTVSSTLASDAREPSHGPARGADLASGRRSEQDEQDEAADLRATALAAWQTHLELLFAALHGDVRCPWPADRTARLQEGYAQRLG